MVRYILPVCLALLAAGCGEPTPEEIARREEWDTLFEAKWALTQQARDPDSIEFRNVRVAPVQLHDSPTVCGEFNGKNGFGGMSGFTRFLSIGRVPMADDGSEAFILLWREAGC